MILQEAELDDVILQDKNYPSSYLLPDSVTGVSLLFDETDMKNFCESLKVKFDYVLLDCPAESKRNVRNVILEQMSWL